MPPINTPDQLFHDGDPTQGIEGTLVTAGYLNNQQGATRDLQQELLNVLGGAHIQPDPQKTDQLLTALRALLLSRKNPFGDIKLDGTVQKALENLGLGEGSALPVGVPIPWPSATPPTGWLKCNGAAFTASQYPKLAQAYPALRLPDLRGEFIRGWDDGRGVDAGRELLSSQEHTVISHNHAIPTTVNTPTAIPPGVEQVIANETIFSPAAQYGCDYWANGGRTFTYMSGGKNGAENINDASSMKGETRPRNVVFNYIVRAA
ncbi:TPA: tail fiber protein [Escherichia coli]|nr:tail fiber protein [Escherichia coli]